MLTCCKNNNTRILKEYMMAIVLVPVFTVTIDRFVCNKAYDLIITECLNVTHTDCVRHIDGLMNFH